MNSKKGWKWNEKKNKICKAKKRPEPEGSWPLKNSISIHIHNDHQLIQVSEQHWDIYRGSITHKSQRLIPWDDKLWAKVKYIIFHPMGWKIWSYSRLMWKWNQWFYSDSDSRESPIPKFLEGNSCENRIGIESVILFRFQFFENISE